MIRSTLLVVVILGIVVAGLLWVSGESGQVSIEWGEWLIETQVAYFALGIITVVILALVIIGFLQLTFRAPGKIRDRLRLSRRHRGYRALTQGMVAVAAGEPDEALKYARRATSQLVEPPLTMLLSAQAAQLQGDEAAARKYFTAMLDQPETAFLGLRGLLMQAERDGDRYAAYEYACRAQELRPGASWVLRTILDFRTWKNDWSGALHVLEEMDGHHRLTEISREGRAAVLLGCSGEAENSGNLASAQKFAHRAQALAPGYLPAVLRNVEIQIRTGKKRSAIRLIQEAWKRTPHPELARIYGSVNEGNEPLSRVRLFERLLSLNEDHEESHIALAEASLSAELWGEARNHLEKAAGHELSARICRLMSDLAEHEHKDSDESRSWLLRASSATPDPAWVCSNCATAWQEWTPACEECAALGTLNWLPPARAQAPRRPVGDSGPGDPDDLLLTEEAPTGLPVAVTTKPKTFVARFRQRG